MGYEDWTIDQLQRELQVKQRERDRLQDEVEEMRAHMQRERSRNPDYWERGEGSEGGVEPNYDIMYRHIDGIEQEMQAIEGELKRRR